MFQMNSLIESSFGIQSENQYLIKRGSSLALSQDPRFQIVSRVDMGSMRSSI